MKKLINEELPSIDFLYKGNYTFTETLPIGLSQYKDVVWSEYDPSSPQSNCFSSHSINWQSFTGVSIKESKNKKYNYCITASMIDDLKTVAITMMYYPTILKRNKTNLQFKTVQMEIQTLAKFFSLIILESRKINENIESFSDISWSLLKKTIPKYTGRGDALKRALRLLSNNVIQSNFVHGELDWSINDILSKTIRWPESKNLGGYQPFSDELFLFISNHAKEKVGNFKFAIEHKLYDKDAGKLTRSEFSKSYPCLKDSIPEWLENLRGSKNIKFNFFEKKYMYSIKDVRKICRDAHISAMWIIFLYTGMRLSESKYIRIGCLDKSNGYWFLYSGLKKQQGNNTPDNQETWLAIDIVRDAVEILEYFCNLTNNRYLFSSYDKNSTGLPYKNLANKFNRYFQSINEENKFSNESISPHRFRETLVNQLAKADVGLSYISMQLKHFHTKFKIIPNDVTVGYGNYKSSLIKSITSYTADAREESFLDIYGIDKSFAGGAAKKHIVKVESFFKGIGLFGEERNAYIKNLSETNYPLIPTSIGGCTRNHTEPCTKSNSPSCYGDYMCDPDCSNHLLSESSMAVLIQRRDGAIEQSNRPEQTHNKKIWLGLANSLNNHILKFNKE